MSSCKLNKKPFFLTLGWIILVLLTLDVSLGSYAEAEPFAGNFFLIVTGVFIAAGIGLFIKYKPQFLKTA